MPREEEIRIREGSKAIKVIIVDETPEDWRMWNAFTQVLTSPNDLGLKIYVVLLERKERMSTRSVSSQVNASIYSVRRALTNLHEFGIVSRERFERGSMITDYWSLKTPLIGILRLIPEQYFQDGYPKS